MKAACIGLGCVQLWLHVRSQATVIVLPARLPQECIAVARHGRTLYAVTDSSLGFSAI